MRNPIWSSLIKFDQVWSKKIQNKTAIFTLFVNVTTFYSNIFWLVKNSVWSSLIKFDQVWSILDLSFDSDFFDYFSEHVCLSTLALSLWSHHICTLLIKKRHCVKKAKRQNVRKSKNRNWHSFIYNGNYHFISRNLSMKW